MGLLQPEVPQQGVNLRLAAAEVDPHVHEVRGTADRKDLLAEALPGLLIEEVVSSKAFRVTIAQWRNRVPGTFSYPFPFKRLLFQDILFQIYKHIFQIGNKNFTVKLIVHSVDT